MPNDYSENRFQVLVKRNPALTPIDFVRHWHHTHAPLAVPYLLAKGCVYYAQIQDLTSARLLEPMSHPDLRLDDWDGAVVIELKLDMAKTLSKHEFNEWKKYHNEILLPDERRMLVNEWTQHGKFLAPSTIYGREVVFIDRRAEGAASGADSTPEQMSPRKLSRPQKL